MNFRRTLARIRKKLFAKPFHKDKRYQAYWFDKVLKDESAFIVQIGSNDGKTGDPLYQLMHKHHHWSGLFVEPIPEYFQKLKNNYKDSSRFSFENVAINEGKTMTFYWVDSEAKESIPDLPYWYDQLGSFDKGHIINQLDGILEPFIRTKQLEGISLSSLLNRNGIDNISILHIDAEGYDWKILSQLDLSIFQPNFILYEYNHLSSKDRQASFSFLEKNYELFDVGIDILAVHKNTKSEYLKGMKKNIKKLQ